MTANSRETIERQLQISQGGRAGALKQAEMLTEHAGGWQERADEFTAEINKLRQQLRDLDKPVEPMPQSGKTPVVISFQKRRPGVDKVYNFAAIRGGLGQRQWAVTQTAHAGPAQPPMSWDGLLKFIGEADWDSITVLHEPQKTTININATSGVDHDAWSAARRDMQAMNYTPGRW